MSEPKTRSRTRGEGAAESTADDEAPRGTRVEVRDLTHRFVNPHSGESVLAVRDVNIDIQPGEFVTVVGPSGCGKSTLLKAIAGLISPSEGEVLSGGTKVRGPGADRGVVFQELAIMPWRTVQKNIEHGLEIQKVPRHKRHDRAKRLIDVMGLTGFENRYPHELSGGMRQRVAVARTWVTEPSVILMDEPFSAVDAQTRITLQEELIRMSAQSNSTLLFITHNVEEAVFLGDRIAVFSKRPGTIKEILPFDVPRAERSIETLTDPTFQSLSDEVMRAVRAEV